MDPQITPMCKGLRLLHKHSMSSGARQEELIAMAQLDQPQVENQSRGLETKAWPYQVGKVYNNIHVNVPHPLYPFLPKDRCLIFTRKTSK